MLLVLQGLDVCRPSAHYMRERERERDDDEVVKGDVDDDAVSVWAVARHSHSIVAHVTN